MPQTVTGEGYRDFSEPRFFECAAESEVEQIRQPVNKAHAFVAPADGLTDLVLWKFDSASAAVASATVIVPLNPAYASAGRWIKIPVGGGSGGGGAFQSGSGDPEGVADAGDGQFYFDTDASPSGQAFYANLSTSGTTGWFLLLQF